MDGVFCNRVFERYFTSYISSVARPLWQPPQTRNNCDGIRINYTPVFDPLFVGARRHRERISLRFDYSAAENPCIWIWHDENSKSGGVKSRGLFNNSSVTVRRMSSNGHRPTVNLSLRFENAKFLAHVTRQRLSAKPFTPCCNALPICS